MEVGTGVGFTVGPPIGSLLYTVSSLPKYENIEHHNIYIILHRLEGSKHRSSL